ncbi:histidine phosphatase family protein [Pigmentiphaga aceris]|nr:histidine phosphatase family protein [Pigmentiphaga aceris]
MSVIHLVRHGESEANAGLATDDPALIALTDTGRRQARDLAEWFSVQPNAVMSSHYERAKDTAQPYAERWQLPISQDAMLHECVTLSPRIVGGTDAAARKPLVDAYWSAADPLMRHGDDSESFAEFAARVEDFRQRLDTVADGTVIFGHGLWFAMLLWQLQGFTYADSLAMCAFRRWQVALPMPNCGVYRLTGSGADWAIRFDDALYRRLHHGQTPVETDVMGGA